jgi:hypothetical protein
MPVQSNQTRFLVPTLLNTGLCKFFHLSRKRPCYLFRLISISEKISLDIWMGYELITNPWTKPDKQHNVEIKTTFFPCPMRDSKQHAVCPVSHRPYRNTKHILSLRLSLRLCVSVLWRRVNAYVVTEGLDKPAASIFSTRVSMFLWYIGHNVQSF